MRFLTGIGEGMRQRRLDDEYVANQQQRRNMARERQTFDLTRLRDQDAYNRQTRMDPAMAQEMNRTKFDLTKLGKQTAEANLNTARRNEAAQLQDKKDREQAMRVTDLGVKMLGSYLNGKEDEFNKYRHEWDVSKNMSGRRITGIGYNDKGELEIELNDGQKAAYSPGALSYIKQRYASGAQATAEAQQKAQMANAKLSLEKRKLDIAAGKVRSDQQSKQVAARQKRVKIYDDKIYKLRNDIDQLESNAVRDGIDVDGVKNRMIGRMRRLVKQRNLSIIDSSSQRAIEGQKFPSCLQRIKEKGGNERARNKRVEYRERASAKQRNRVD